MRLAFLLIFALLTSFSFINSLNAEVGGGLLITPKRIVFNEGDRVQTIRMVNRGSKPQQFRVSLVNRKMLENGSLQETAEPGENEFFADKVLRYGPRKIELDSKGAQTIRLMSRLTANEPDGEYRSHILIQQLPEAAQAAQANDDGSGTLSVNVQALFGVTIPVFIRKGELSAEAYLSNPSVLREENGTYVKFDINRSGNKSIFGTAQVFLDGTQIAILKGIAVYLSHTHRTVYLEIPEEYANTISGKELQITYSAQEKEEDAPAAEISFTAG